MNAVTDMLRSRDPKALLSGAAWSALGQASLAMSQWGIVVVLARLVSPTAVGEFALGLALTAPLFGFSNMCLAQLQATDVRAQHPFGAYAAVRIMSTVLALLLLPLIVLDSSAARGAMFVAIAFGVARAADGASDVCYGLMQRHGEFRTIGQSMLFRSLLGGIGAIAALSLDPTGLGAACGLACGWIAWALLGDLPSARRLLKRQGRLAEWRLQFDRRSVAGISRDGLPLSLVMGLNMVAINMPRYWIAAELGNEQLGFFAAIAYLMVAANMVVTAINQAFVPRLADDFVQAPRRYCRLVGAMVLGALLLGLAGVAVASAAGRQILTLIYAAKYAGFQSTLVWTMLGTAVTLLVAVTGAAMTAARRFKAQVWNSLAAVLATGIACVALVKPLGIDGAAIAVLAGLLAKLFGQCMVLAQMMPLAWARHEELTA